MSDKQAKEEAEKYRRADYISSKEYRANLHRLEEIRLLMRRDSPELTDDNQLEVRAAFVCTFKTPEAPVDADYWLSTPLSNCQSWQST
jgi:hypothetical protein